MPARLTKASAAVKRPRATAGAAAGASEFKGFSPKALQFFMALEAHQTKEWFHANKASYEALVLQPMDLFLQAASDALKAKRIPLEGTLKSSVFRINRDVRFSKDKQPYKNHVGAVLTRDGTKQSQGLIYLHLSPVECFAAAGFYALEPEPLASFRRAIVNAPARWRTTVAALKAAGLELSREDALARLPRGFPADKTGELGEAVVEDLKLKSYIVRQPLRAATVRSAALVDTVVDLARATKPLLDFGWAALGPGSAPRAD